MANGDADMLKIVLNALPLLIRTCHLTKEQVLDLLKAKDFMVAQTISGDAKWT